MPKKRRQSRRSWKSSRPEEEAKKAAEEAEAEAEAEEEKDFDITGIASKFLGVIALVGLAAGGGFYFFIQKKEEGAGGQGKRGPGTQITGR